MQFTTHIPIPKSSHPVDYTSHVVSLGSCFAVNIGAKFDYFKFTNTNNPFGILFSPTALEKFIGFAVNQKTFTEADIFYHNERWHCFDAHSDLSHPKKRVLLENLNKSVTKTHQHITSATHIIITLGTAWVYRNVQSGLLVANCHKIPQKEFSKELLSVTEIQQSIKSLLAHIAYVNSHATVIFTVSPVRHIKDGFVQNQHSKANLITALHEILNTEHGILNTTYFPSYEIMMDELRDYRFYAEDMIHPNQTAIDYIWERFKQTHITDAAQQTMKLVDTVQKGLNHRPFNPYSAEHNAFKVSLQEKINTLHQAHPHITF